MERKVTYVSSVPGFPEVPRGTVGHSGVGALCAWATCFRRGKLQSCLRPYSPASTEGLMPRLCQPRGPACEPLTGRWGHLAYLRRAEACQHLLGQSLHARSRIHPVLGLCPRLAFALPVGRVSVTQLKSLGDDICEGLEV